MPVRTQPLYDTVTLGTAATTTHQIFNVQENSDSNHPTNITNMKGNGALPQNDKMTVHMLGCYVDQEPAEADIPLIWTRNYLRIQIAQQEWITIPLVALAMYDSYGGSVSQAAASDFVAIGRQGKGFKLDTPIVIPGGSQLTVEVFQFTALSANTLLKVLLLGEYDYGG